MPFWSRGSESKSSSSVEKDLSDDNNNDTSSFGLLPADGTSILADGGDHSSHISPTVPNSSQESSPSPSSSAEDEVNATVSEPWTRIFPEAYGIRQSIEDSSFRWCVRESMLWGVATGTMMGV